MRAVLALLVAALALPAYSQSPAVAGKRTLVIVEDEEVRGSHSQLFAALEGRGHELTFLRTGEEAVLRKYDEAQFDNLLLFAPTASKPAGLGADELAEFVDLGGNLVMAASQTSEHGVPRVGPTVRDLAAELGVALHRDGTALQDHIMAAVAADAGQHTRFVAHGLVESPAIVGAPDRGVGGFLADGIGMTLDEEDVLSVAAVRGGPSTLSAGVGSALTAKPESAGDATTIVAAVQARNNARAVVLPSLWVCSDEAANLPGEWAGSTAAGQAAVSRLPSRNGPLCDSLTAWAFQERGVIRAVNPTHRRADGRAAELMLEPHPDADLPKSYFPEPEVDRSSLFYRIKDLLRFELTLQEFNGTAWVPYVADDVQLEFVMLDPYVRTALPVVDASAGLYASEFRAPDTWGVYKFRVMYRRVGLSVVQVEETVSVRPPRHNEYDRFISSAFPYYTVAFTLMAATVVFAFLFLRSSSLPAAAARK